MRDFAQAAGPVPVASHESLRRQERAENFPVALRLLPADIRRHLSAIYDVARVVDDLGDAADGDRTTLLLDFREDLSLVWTTGRPTLRVLRQLVPTVELCRLSEETFQNLVQANLQDQVVHSYDSFEDLRDYCRLSAGPVGRLVLAVFGAATPRTERLSDAVCTALQLLEFWQDVAEDRQAGRVYLPRQSLVLYGVDEWQLDAPRASPALRRLLDAETRRAECLLDNGSELVGLLEGWAKVAVAGYVAGGRATAAALRRANFDVLSVTPRPRGTDTVLHAAGLLTGVTR
jgi:squalene synthase HpnC